MISLTTRLQIVMLKQPMNYISHSDLLLYMRVYFPSYTVNKAEINSLLDWLVKTNVVKETQDPISNTHYYTWLTTPAYNLNLMIERLRI